MEMSVWGLETRLEKLRVRTCPEGQCKYWTKRKAEEGHDVVRTCRDH